MTLAKVKEQDGMMLAKVKEQDGMVLAKVKEQDGIVLVKVPSIPTVSGLIAVMHDLQQMWNPLSIPWPVNCFIRLCPPLRFKALM